MSRKPYSTDLTDAQWELLEPYIPKPKSGTRKGGRPAVDRREGGNALFYHPRGGEAWGVLPPDFPPFKTGFHYYAAWRESGPWGGEWFGVRGGGWSWPFLGPQSPG